MEELLETLLERNAKAGRWQRWPVNISLAVINGTLFSMLPFGLLLVANWAESTGTGLFNLVGELSSPIHFAVTVVFLNLGQYVFHRLSHATTSRFDVTGD